MRRRTTELLASIILLVVWIATPLFAVVHVAVEEHRFCAEHQRLEEGASAHQDDAVIAAAPEIVVSERVLRSPDVPQRAHEVCASVDCLSVDTLRPDAKGQSIVAVASVYATPLLLRAQYTYRIAPILIAPKCSPPFFV